MKKLLILILICFASFNLQAQTSLYLRLEYWASNLDIHWLYFKDSALVRNPKFGINPLQLEKETAENKENVAKVLQVSDNKMALKWNNGISQAVNIQFKGKDLSSFHGVACEKAVPFQITRFDDKTYTGLVYFNNLSRDITLFLGKDGSFTYEKKDASGIQKEAGTYTLNGNIIDFKYTSGKTWQALIHTYDLGNEEIIINDQLFTKVKK